MPLLKVLRGPPSLPLEHVIDSDRVALGRDRTCAVRLERRDISRLHAAVVRVSGEYHLIDCDSHNGTRLNGERLEPGRPYLLGYGDLIELGEVVLCFRSDIFDAGAGESANFLAPAAKIRQDSLCPATRAAIDLECDRFEEAWKAGHPRGIDLHLQSAWRTEHRSAHEQLLVELVLIDLEYRWRANCGGAASFQLDHPVAASNGGTVPHKVEDYLRNFPELGLVKKIQLELAATEYRVRQQWGDRPRCGEYQERFPQLEGELDQLLRPIALALTPSLIRVYEGSDLVFSAKMSGALEIGRQTKSEPPPVCRVAGDKAERIVIAPREEKGISRIHVRLEIVAKDEFQIENHSRHSIPCCGETESLNGGESLYLRVPFDISLGTKRVRLEAV